MRGGPGVITSEVLAVAVGVTSAGSQPHGAPGVVETFESTHLS